MFEDGTIQFKSHLKDNFEKYCKENNGQYLVLTKSAIELTEKFYSDRNSFLKYYEPFEIRAGATSTWIRIPSKFNLFRKHLMKKSINSLEKDSSIFFLSLDNFLQKIYLTITK